MASYLLLLSFLIFKMIASSSFIKIVSTSVKCDSKKQITAKYVVSSDVVSIHNMLYSVASCMPTYRNHYCQSDETIWAKQTCETTRIFADVSSIKCNVSTPNQGIDTNYRAFGLQISVLEPQTGRKFEELTPITPVFVCGVVNGKKKVKSYKRSVYELFKLSEAL